MNTADNTISEQEKQNITRDRIDSRTRGMYIILAIFLLGVIIQIAFMSEWTLACSVFNLLDCRYTKPLISVFSVIFGFLSTKNWRDEVLNCRPEKSPSLIKNKNTRARYWNRIKSYLFISNSLFYFGLSECFILPRELEQGLTIAGIGLAGFIAIEVLLLTGRDIEDSEGKIAIHLEKIANEINSIKSELDVFKNQRFKLLEMQPHSSNKRIKKKALRFLCIIGF